MQHIFLVYRRPAIIRVADHTKIINASSYCWHKLPTANKSFCEHKQRLDNQFNGNHTKYELILGPTIAQREHAAALHHGTMSQGIRSIPANQLDDDIQYLYLHTTSLTWYEVFAVCSVTWSLRSDWLFCVSWCGGSPLIRPCNLIPVFPDFSKVE